MITAEKMNLILTAIRESKEFRLKFASVATVITDKIYSFYRNPNCSCKNTIIDWITKNEEATNKLLEENKEQLVVIQEKSKTQESLLSNKQPPATPPTSPTQTENTPRLPSNNVKIGEYVVIPADPEAYKKLFEQIKAERWVFRGVNLVTDEQNHKWIILFY